MDLRSPPLEPSDGEARREAPLGAAGLSGRRHRLDRPGLSRDLSGCRAQWTDGSKASASCHNLRTNSAVKTEPEALCSTRRRRGEPTHLAKLSTLYVII